jgi:riboflavin kinase/FMN adenylyltransferase
MSKVIDFNDNSIDVPSSVITLGNFDGLHLGHADLINNLISESKDRRGSRSILITFNPHTQNVLNPDKEVKVITPNEEKINLLCNYNIDYISVIKFNTRISKLSPEEFIDLIISKYNPQSIIIGYDSRFGYKGRGNYSFIKKYLFNKNIKVLKNKPYALNDVIIKSSLIKKVINDGDIKSANMYLGRGFSLFGKIIKGDKIGSSIGFPTANLHLNNKQQIIPKVGVYCVTLFFDNAEYKALCNIGYRPTFFENSKLSIESYILNYNESVLYDKEVRIKFNFHIRKEKKFENKEDLVKQINEDIKVLDSTY